MGSFVGVQIYAELRAIGQIDLFIYLCYVIFLGVIGSLMLIEKPARHTLRTAWQADTR